MNKNYEALENRFNRMDALGGAISMLYWDMSAMMPKGGTASRTDQLAVLKTLHHSMITDSEVPELLDGAEQDEHEPEQDHHVEQPGEGVQQRAHHLPHARERRHRA